MTAGSDRAGTDPAGAGYDERLYPAGWIWAVALFLAVGLGLSLSVIGLEVGLVTAALACGGVAGLLVRTTPSITVGDGELRAGTARIPVDLIGEAQVLDAADMRHAVGPGLDARAYLCIRGWIATGVRVTVTDPADPTPYWLVSSRSPDRLAAAVAAERV